MIGRRDAAWLAAAAVLLAAMGGRALWSGAFCWMNFGDLYAYHYPLRHLEVSSLQAGRLPFWNPYVFSGQPLAANPQAELFYPGLLLGAFFPLTQALSWDVLLHWLWAWLGWTTLARREGLRASEAFALGALFALCPFVVYRITEGIPTLLAALAWTPWCWLAWLSGRRWVLACAWALAFLSGHPQFLLLNALAMALWGVVSSRSWRPLAVLAREGCAALALTCAQWLPTWRFVARSVRRSWPASFSLGYSLDWTSLAALLHPGAAGDPVSRSYAGPPSVFFEGNGLFLGLGGLALAAWGLWRGRRAGAAALLAAGLALASGSHDPAYPWLLGHTPAGLLRTPSRSLLLCLIALLACAGAAMRRAAGPWREDRRLRALALAVIVVELAAWDFRFARPEPAAPYLAFNAELARAAGGAPLRVLTDPNLASADKTQLYRVRNVNGYDAFYLDGYPQYAAKSEGRPAADASRTYLRDPDTEAMRRLGVAYLLSSSGRLVSAKRPLPLVYAAKDGAAAALPRLDLDLPRPEAWSARLRPPRGARRLVLSQPLYPGWKAWLDGRPAELSLWDGWLQSVELPERTADGAMDLEARFSPEGWPWLALAGALAWSVWLGWGAKEAFT